MMIRDEVVLRTACGCEKIVAASANEHRIRTAIAVDPQPWNGDLVADQTYQIRSFVFGGELDGLGRRVFQERIANTLNWEHKYHQLYQEVYGMDKGL